MTDAWSVVRALALAAPQGEEAPPDDRWRVEAAGGDGAFAYGELDEASMARLLAWLRLGPDDALFDLGSGTGKVVLQAACTTAVGRAVGVELSPFRHRVAADTLARALAALPPADAARLAARVELQQLDLRRADLAAATVVYTASTAMPDPLLAELAEHVERAAPRLRALLSTRALPPPWDERFEELGRVRVVASWSAWERVVVYRRRVTRP